MSTRVLASRWLARARTPAGTTALLALAFIAISAWWLAVDDRLPNSDSGKHLFFAFSYSDMLQAHNWLQPFLTWNQYPPGVHMVGAVSSWLFGISADRAVFAENLVFVPLLAIGCYGAASLASDRRAGVLAAVFAFATPMFISLMHSFLLDGAQACAVAISVWLLLLSDRFRRTGVTVAAGIAVGLGFYTKATFPIFIAGLLAVMLVRGGWRNWRNVLLFVVIAFAIFDPWYANHYIDLKGQTTSVTGASVPTGSASRWTVDNFTAYTWRGLSVQFLLPLSLFFLAGLGAGIWTWVRDRSRSSLIPELVGGALVSYLGISYLALDDPRYTLPALVYVAVLGTWWIPRATPLVQRVATVALVGVLVLNTLWVSFGVAGNHGAYIYLPKALNSHELTVVYPGYIDGGPNSNGHGVIAILEAAKRSGAVQAGTDIASLNLTPYHYYSVWVSSWEIGLAPQATQAPLGPRDVFLLRLDIEKVGEPPCFDIGDGTGIYVKRGPKPDAPFTCPLDET